MSLKLENVFKKGFAVLEFIVGDVDKDGLLDLLATKMLLILKPRLIVLINCDGRASNRAKKTAAMMKRQDSHL